MPACPRIFPGTIRSHHWAVEADLVLGVEEGIHANGIGVGAEGVVVVGRATDVDAADELHDVAVAEFFVLGGR